MTNQVIYQDLGLATLSQDAERLLRDVVQKSAHDVEAQMKVNIVDRGFFDTGATVNSVAVSPTLNPLEADIGPSTHYAIYGEMGWERMTTKGNVVRFAGLHFARDALYSVKDSFFAAIGAAMQKLGRG